MTKTMTLTKYQREAMTTRTKSTYGKQKIVYPTLGLTGEAGEVAEKVKKVLRDNKGKFTEEERRKIAMELGDVMWYVAALAKDIGYTLQQVCEMNLEKLADRKQRDVIHGSGDER